MRGDVPVVCDGFELRLPPREAVEPIQHRIHPLLIASRQEVDLLLYQLLEAGDSICYHFLD